MTKTHTTHELSNLESAEYEAPMLTEIGEASQIVLGIVGGGFDGDFGMTESQFEFEPDGELS
jgi:hypothetical protein